MTLDCVFSTGGILGDLLRTPPVYLIFSYNNGFGLDEARILAKVLSMHLWYTYNVFYLSIRITVHLQKAHSVGLGGNIKDSFKDVGSRL